MLLPIIAVLIGVAVAPLTASEVANDAKVIANTLDLDDLKIRITPLQGSDNPSPLLVKYTSSACTIYVNNGATAHAVWNRFLSDADGEYAAALRDFAVAHEIGHCVVARLRSEAVEMPPLLGTAGAVLPVGSVTSGAVSSAFTGDETARGISIKNYDEIASDLIGLHFIRIAHPTAFDPVRNRVREVRAQLAAKDPMHDSSGYLAERNLASIAKLVERFE